MESAIASLQHWWELAGVDLDYDVEPRALLQPRERSTENGAKAQASATQAKNPTSLPPLAPRNYPGNLPEFQTFLSDRDNLIESAWASEFASLSGPTNPKIMTISAIPEKTNDRALSPFGQENQILTEKMLAAIGCDSDQAYFASITLARPSDGQVPDELWPNFRERVEHHIKLVHPERVICFGDLASKILFESDLLSARKKKLNINHVASKTEVIVTFHPRILIERPELKAEAWKDLQRLTRIDAS